MSVPGLAVLDRLAPGDGGLRLQDLGSLLLRVAGTDAAVRGAKPARILVTLLVHANQRVSVDAMIDAVWGEQASDAGAGALETQIWRLRKVIEPGRDRRQEPTYLINDAGGYRLVVNPENADSLRFPQLAEQGDRLLATGDPDRALRRYELALGLWRGRPFDPVADEVWAAAPIARLEEMYGQVNERRIEALLLTGAQDQAVRDLEDLIGRLPYRERLWSHLMTGLYQAGRVQEALTAYQRAREASLDALGLEPGAGLREVERKILHQDPALSPPRSASAAAGGPDWRQPVGTAREIHLPTRLSAFVGRAAELKRISRLAGRSRLVTMVGAGGCGKTRLAVEVARTVASLTPDGVWFVDLTAIDDPAAVPDFIVATLGLGQLPVGTALGALRSYVRDRQILLVIDNCEHVLTAVYQLLDVLLGEDSQCRVLATSREPVGLDGEVLWTVAPLAVRGQPTSDDDALSAAARLFVARAEDADPLFEPTGQILDQVESICAAVDGIPLAIELAAGLIRSASLAEVHQQVSTELAGLGRVGRTRTEHHRTVELSIDWSVRMLSAAERAVHQSLSVLPGIFTAAAARAVAGTGQVLPDDIPALLTQLAHRSLLTVVPGEGPSGRPASGPARPTRFRQLATVRAHAASALAAAGEKGAALDRRTAFIMDLAAARPPDNGPDTAGWNAALDDNHDTLAAVLQDTLLDRPHPAGVHLAGWISSYWFYRGRVAEGSRWLQSAVEQATAPATDLAVAELALAYLSALRDRTDITLRLVRSALSRGGVNPREIVYGLVASAWCAKLRGDEALDFVDDEVQRFAESGNDPVVSMWAEVLSAKTALASDDPALLAPRFEILIERAERQGNITYAWLSAWLAVICDLLKGDAAGGRTHLERVDGYMRRLGGATVATSVEYQGSFAAMTGEYEQAARLFGRASAMSFRIGTPWPTSVRTEPMLTKTRTCLAADRFNDAWRTGEADAALR
jgi:predicted ATPase/DNA-binding SARP family transcriptional activator